MSRTDVSSQFVSSFASSVPGGKKRRKRKERSDVRSKLHMRINRDLGEIVSSEHVIMPSTP